MTLQHTPDRPAPPGTSSATPVHGERTLRTAVEGQLVVTPCAVAWVRAPVHRDVTVLPGGRAQLLAPVSGQLKRTR